MIILSDGAKKIQDNEQIVAVSIKTARRPTGAGARCGWYGQRGGMLLICFSRFNRNLFDLVLFRLRQFHFENAVLNGCRQVL
jgi:hypothetical protein